MTELAGFTVPTATKILEATRRTLATPPTSHRPPAAPQQIGPRRRFGVTKGSTEHAYPAEGDGVNVLPFVFADRSYSAAAPGASVVSKLEWTLTVLGSSVDENYIAEGTLCWVDYDGLNYWLEPIAVDELACDWLPKRWSKLPGYVAGETQMIVHLADECPKWMTVGPCEPPGEA